LSQRPSNRHRGWTGRSGSDSDALEGVAARALALSTVSFIVDLLSKVDGTVLHARNLALNVVCSVKKALEVEAEQDECAARDFACTLLVAVVDQHRATFWQIGDGAICFRFPSEIEAGKKKCSELVMLWAGSLALSSPLSVQAC
jgi:hypothetical protein